MMTILSRYFSRCINTFELTSASATLIIISHRRMTACNTELAHKIDDDDGNGQYTFCLSFKSLSPGLRVGELLRRVDIEDDEAL